MLLRPAAEDERAPAGAASLIRPRFAEDGRPGLRFAERMEGRFEWIAGGLQGITRDQRMQRWAAIAESTAGLRLDVSLTVLADDLEHFLSSCEHAARLLGTVEAPELSSAPLAVRNGHFGFCVVDPNLVETRHMSYEMTVKADDGPEVRIRGVKIIRNSSLRRLWPDLTTLYVTIEELGGRRRSGLGVLRLPFRNFLRQLLTLTATNTRGIAERFDTRARFVGFFLGVVRSMYGRSLARAVLSTLDAPPRPRRPLPVPAKGYRVPTSDRTSVHLTRYRGGLRGPVILSPGFSVSATSFAAETVGQNFVEYLLERQYDVWLFDYRASSSFEAAGTTFSIDDIALRDYPAAVEKVQQETGAAKVQFVVHCVGSMSLLMSILLGERTDMQRRVRSIVCSQLGLHPISPGLTRLKTSLRVASLLRWLGVRTMSADFNPYEFRDRLTDKLLTLLPTHERCNNPACRRIQWLFGESFRHAQLNTATHDAIDSWFGTTSVPALCHLALMVRTGHVVDRDGRETYMRNLRPLALPISFIHGKENREFVPDSTLKTYKALCAANGPAWYRRLELLEGYGHMDCFIGRNAARDVFPKIEGELANPPPG